jgi:hypothetical protein
MSLDFRPDAPADVLAAFAALEQPLPGDAYWGPAPQLPEPVTEPSELWEPDWRDAGYDDEFADEPWRHDWASWLRNSMSVGTAPYAALVWMPSKCWQLTCRASFKAPAESVFTFLEWLGPYIHSYDQDRAKLIGYIDYENDARPHLVWYKGGKLVREDLNACEGPVP